MRNVEPLAYPINDWCAAVGVSRRTYYNLKRRGEAPKVIRIGGRQFITRAEAERYLAEREAQDV